MSHIFYEEFDELRSTYCNATSREEKLIKHKLDSIVSLYENCDVKEREFADEITLEFSRIIALLKNQHQKEIAELNQKYEALQKQQESTRSSYIPCSQAETHPTFECDYHLLGEFYNHFKKAEQLPYWEIDGYKFESDEQRKELVNYTMLDYVSRIKTFANKYLYEIFPEEAVQLTAGDDEAPDGVVFTYNNLEVILAKMKTKNEEGKIIKQRLNIRSALRKLNEFKQKEQHTNF